MPVGIATFLSNHEPAIVTIVYPRRETPLPHHEISLMIKVIRRIRARNLHIGCVVMCGANSVSQCKAMVSNAGLEDHFHFAGEVVHQDCVATMKNGDVFVRTLTVSRSALFGDKGRDVRSVSGRSSRRSTPSREGAP